MSALFVVPYPSDVGFAIDRLVSAFLSAFSGMNGGDNSGAHFSFTSLTGGPSKALPKDFANVIGFDPIKIPNPAFESYVRENRIDLVVLLDEQPACRLAGYLKKLGVKCVVSYWGAPISGPSRRLRRLLKRIGLALAHRRRVDALIFESRAMATLAISGRGCPRAMLELVPTGTDPRRFSPTSQKSYVHELFNIDHRRLIVVFAGHVHERKGIGTLVDAASILIGDRQRSDLFFLVCGDRNQEADPYIERLRASGVEASVRFAGYRSDIAAILAHSDIGVIPSTGWDSFPMSALDMAAAGLPLVGSQLGGLPEVIVDGETGVLARTGDPDDLADKIQYFADNPGARLEFGSRGRQRIEQHFTLEIQSRRLQEVLSRRLRRALPSGADMGAPGPNQ